MPKETTKDLGLQQIPGITPIFSQLLSEAGIKTLSDLGSASPETIAEVLSVPGVLPVGPDTAAAWIRQARDILGE
jgi:predicted flap endonuclease-1-like 5' DNA nuclease